MAERSGQSEGRTNKTRQHRLKLLLRENLKRRKVQERERSTLADAPSSSHEAPPHGRVGKDGEE